MKPMIAPTLFTCSLLLTFAAFANKGAAYHSQPVHKSTDNLDWSKGWYIGVGVNADSEFITNTNGASLPIGFTTDKVRYDSNNTGFDVYIGREISPYWAAEFGYSYVGNIDFTGETDHVHEQTASVRQWNVHTVGLGRVPLGYHMNFMYKGGLTWYYNSGKFHDLTLDEITHNKYRGFALTYGAGLEVTWDQFALRGDYTFISPPSNIQDDFWISNLIGVSMIYKFI
jgi:hypothetical protein